MNNSRQYESRFFTKADCSVSKLIFELPQVWWSRFYEYEWARQFCRTEDVVLDAACGLAHPLKFYLADHCREVHCCDADPRILDKGEILRDISETFGETVASQFPERYFSQIDFRQALVQALPYPDGYFDKVYCISVLEHLNDELNQSELLTVNALTLNMVNHREIYDSLREFRRVLKDDGLIILTFDYPSINLNYLINLAAQQGLTFAGPLDCRLPADALYSTLWNLFCFRAVFQKE